MVEAALHEATRNINRVQACIGYPSSAHPAEFAMLDRAHSAITAAELAMESLKAHIKPFQKTTSGSWITDKQDRYRRTCQQQAFQDARNAKPTTITN